MKRCIEVTELRRSLPAKDYLRRVHGYSTRYLKNIRLYGQLLRNGLPLRMIDPVFPGDQLQIADRAACESSEIRLRESAQSLLLAEEENYFVALKKAGLLTHPKNKRELMSLSHILSDQPLHLVSRLDRDTSGLVLVAKNPYYQELLRQSDMKKIYLLIFHGRFSRTRTSVSLRIARREGSLIERTVSSLGQKAHTEYLELAYNEKLDLSLLACRLRSGRTHQIRVHSLFTGHPLLGETLYGLDRLTALSSSDSRLLDARCPLEIRKALDREFARQALHAFFLSFNDPLSGEERKYHAPLPTDFALALRRYFSFCLPEDEMYFVDRAEEL